MGFIEQISGILRGLKERALVDVYIISPPKSGRTWLSVLLMKIFNERYGTPMDFSMFDLKVGRKHPQIFLSHDLMSPDRTDEELRIDVSKYKGKKVIFLVRDPRDVMASYYYELRKRQEIFSGSRSDLIRSDKFGISRLVDFMNEWWHQFKNADDFLLIKYEDMRRDSGKELKRILNFIGIEIDSDMIRRAVEFTSFERMKKMEREDVFDSKRLRPTDVRDETTYKVRKGKVGGFAEEFEEADIKYMNEQMIDLDKDYAY